MLKLITALLYAGLFLVILWVVPRMLYIPKPATFSLYFGSPGSGKTCFLTRLALKRKDKFKVFCNYPVKIDNVFKFDKNAFDSFEFPEGSLLLFDEGSLNGFDSRDYKTNFAKGNTLEYFKLARHYKNQIVFANQGWDELDKKIRILTNDLWYVRKLPFVSIARRVFQYTEVDELTHQIIDGYKFASGLKYLLIPSYCQIIWRSRYYKYFDSYDRPKRPVYKSIPWVTKKRIILPPNIPPYKPAPQNKEP